MNLTRRLCFWMIYSSYRPIIKVCGRGIYFIKRCVCLLVSELITGSSAPVSSPGWGLCGRVLAKTPYSHSASLHSCWLMSISKCNVVGNPSQLMPQKSNKLSCSICPPLLLLGVEDALDVKQQRTKGQKNEENNINNRFVRPLQLESVIKMQPIKQLYQ